LRNEYGESPPTNSTRFLNPFSQPKAIPAPA